MTIEHSAEQWTAGVTVIGDKEFFAVASAGNTKIIIALCGPVNASDKHESFANARRIVVCVNALEGMPQQVLENGWSYLASQADAGRDRHDEIMNLKCSEAADRYSDSERQAYLAGHRDARHAAAEIVTMVPQQSAQPFIQISHRKYDQERRDSFEQGRLQGHAECASEEKVVGYMTLSGALIQCSAEMALPYGWKPLVVSNRFAPISKITSNENEPEAFHLKIEQALA